MSQSPVNPDPNWPSNLEGRLDRIGKATMEVTIELGRTRMPLREVLQAEPGGVIELDKVMGVPVDIRVNNTLFGRGEIAVYGDTMAVRVTELLSPQTADA